MSSRFIAPVTLRGTHVTLEPLAHEHLDAIRAAASDGAIVARSVEATPYWFLKWASPSSSSSTVHPCSWT